MAFEQGFFELYKIHWVCEKNHEFAHGQVRNPGKCPICKTPLIREVVERK